VTSSAIDSRISAWLTALEARHLANLKVSEVTRALRALSSAYVERRQVVARGGTLDTAGKRAAFALYYAPLHLLTTMAVVNEIGAATPPPPSIVDVGCGTGVGGAAWALSAGGSPFITGIDRHPWAIEEARWTYHALGVAGRTRQGDAQRLPATKRGDGVIAAYVLNELPDAIREAVVAELLRRASMGTRVLIVEPIARAIAPWWQEAARRFEAVDGRADEWRFAVEQPAIITLFGKAAGLNHREVKARTIYAGGNSGRTEGTDAQEARRSGV
jgi:hypothetical protein